MSGATSVQIPSVALLPSLPMQLDKRTKEWPRYLHRSPPSRNGTFRYSNLLNNLDFLYCIVPNLINEPVSHKACNRRSTVHRNLQYQITFFLWKNIFKALFFLFSFSKLLIRQDHNYRLDLKEKFVTIISKSNILDLAIHLRCNEIQTSFVLCIGHVKYI